MMVAIGIGKLGDFLKDEDGATHIEYGLIAVFVGLATIAGLQLLPPALNSIFLIVAGALGAAN